MVAVKVVISGRVQNVSFRRYIKTNADHLGVKGYVKNLENGKVEAVFESDKERVGNMIELCKKGPTFSRVDDIKEEEIESSMRYDSFKILF